MGVEAAAEFEVVAEVEVATEVKAAMEVVGASTGFAMSIVGTGSTLTTSLEGAAAGVEDKGALKRIVSRFHIRLLVLNRCLSLIKRLRRLGCMIVQKKDRATNHNGILGNLSIRRES